MASITLIWIGDLDFLHYLHPRIWASTGGFHRIIWLPLRVPDKCVPLFNKGVIGLVLDAHEVVPNGEMTDQWLGVDAGQYFFAD